MISKLYNYLWPSDDQSKNQDQSTENNNQPTETYDEYDAHGANRWDHVDWSDIDQVEEEWEKYKLSQGKQFLGGLAAGVYFTATGEPLANPPADNKYVQGNRQEFADKLALAADDPRVKDSEHATDAVKVMQGQNYAQESQEEPMPKSTIPIFIKQVYGHVELDEAAREQGKPSASVNAHKAWDIKCHQEHQEAFLKAGYISGNRLHRIAEIKESLTQEGWIESNPTASCDDPVIFHPYTEDDYDRMHSSNGSSCSDSEDNSVEEVPSVEISVEEPKTVEESNNSESPTISVSESRDSFFGTLVTAQKDDEDDMDYLTRLDSIVN